MKYVTVKRLMLKLSPLYSVPNKNAFSVGREHLSFHISLTRSYLYSIFIPLKANLFARLCPSFTDITLPSNPRVEFLGNFSNKYSSIVGTPSSPILNSFIPLSFNSFSACIKYLPSVQSPASSIDIIKVPDDPVKPDINSLDLK